MPDRITLEIATPTRLVVAETVDEIVIPGSQGYFGVLPGHAAFLTTLGIGELMYRVGRDDLVDLFRDHQSHRRGDLEAEPIRHYFVSRSFFAFSIASPMSPTM